MRAVISRVSHARVELTDGTVTGSIDAGLLVLLGVTDADTQAEVALTAKKIAGLRMFDGEPEQSITDLHLPVLLVSQFTLYGDIKKGRRPSFTKAARGEIAEPLYEAVATELRDVHGVHVETGKFGADMTVVSHGNGPYTIWWETPSRA